MRLYLTGGSGFVGSNVARVFGEHHGATVIAPAHAEVDLVDAAAVARSVADARPDAIVHCAILNDFGRLYTHRREAWARYVGATRNLVEAPTRGAPVVLVSTDWVFDGTQGGAREDEPPNPINAYGFLKAASELVVLERAGAGRWRGSPASRACTGRARRRRAARTPASATSSPRSSTPCAPAGGSPCGTGPALNSLATPTLASDAAELMWRAIEREATGILHCCGGESVDRVDAGSAGRRRRSSSTPSCCATGPPDDGAFAGGAVPYDTRLDATATAAALGVELPGVDALLARLRAEIDTGTISPPA